MSILTSAHYAVHCLYLDQGFCIIYMTGFRTDVLKMTIFKIDIFKLIECVEQQENVRVCFSNDLPILRMRIMKQK